MTTLQSNINALLAKATKLNGDNWWGYKFDLEMILRRSGAWGIISEEIKKPGGTRSQDEAWKTWDRLQEEVRTAIGITVEPSQKHYIRNCPDGSSAWAALKAVYKTNTRANRIALKHQLYGYVHDLHEPMQSYINAIEDIVAKLKAIDVKISDDDLCDVLIMRLDPDYDGAATALQARAGTLTPKEVKAVLLEEEVRRKRRKAEAYAGGNGGGNDTALLARGNVQTQ